MIAEFHTTDLTANCLKAVELRHNGKRISTMTSALYRGCLWHEGARLLHERNDWGVADLLVRDADVLVRAKAEEECRPLSPACERDRHETMAEIGRLLNRYAQMFAGVFVKSKLIGCELPVRLTVNVDDQPAEFATHIDLLYRSIDGHLCLWDWKSGEDSPTWEYLTRNLQFGMMHLAVAHGQVMTSPDCWVEFGDAPLMTWVHVNNLAPYGRKTTVTENGEPREYAKGDARPLSSVLRGIEINDEGVILDQFSTRVRMARAGLYPMNPSEQGCHLCESNQFCPNFQRGSDHADQ